ncbi:E3 ubiquitin-protein ligase PRT1 [Acorus calamus]|uniref:E3 ubiquitin-protein ligase PRT1 n=1 Tax=Acorus calamus TaxID=4465 RepID=A0AAV9C6Y3_ACOCL|nr:E3 ubiquitin-protein ligase PRT1 [Acorus calamus]
MEEETAKEPPTKVEDQTLDSMDNTGDDEIDKAFQCFICLDLLYKPVVLEEETKNECFSPQLVDGLMIKTGHELAVYCEDCVHTLVSGALRCQVCQSCHPGGFPKVCLVLDNFLEEHFPEEYARRKDAVQLQQQHACHAGTSTCESKNEGSTKSAQMDGLLQTNGILKFPAHIGVGCDSCGVMPMTGKRYRCIDCVESIGFDLCGDCYESHSKLPGRFNQQHTPDHRFELDWSHYGLVIQSAGHQEIVLHHEEEVDEDLNDPDP